MVFFTTVLFEGEIIIEQATKNEVLNYAIEHGIIDLSYIENKIEMNKREELLKKHPYEIWIGKDNRYYTYFPEKDNKRMLKSRNTRQKIEDCIVDFWKQEMENPTIYELYIEWVDGKLKREEITITTKNRYDRQYNESMIEFGKNRIKAIEEYDIEKFLLEAIHVHKMTAKGFSNLRTLILGIFKLAKKKKLVQYSIKNVIDDMDISRKLFRKVKHEDDELIFMDEEVEKVLNYFKQHKLDLKDLGILLLFYTGMRPGELSALTWDDVNGNIIKIHSTEIRYENENKEYIYEVRDFPKTEAGIRDVIVPQSQLWILKEIKTLNPSGKYVFEQHGQRIRTCLFDDRIRRICSKLKIKEKSLNKIRKTYATTLIDKRVDDSLIIAQMGHTDITTTKNYYYKNRKNMQQKSLIIDKAFD
ncbi:site-specific integrase [Blautia hansenii]|uniref:site-specific integrase n=1 Tax=Blautia hansenii TaxID=1322 RepID=UPI0002E16B3B|nr:site-specific integrase [Blautia hansenii]